MQKNNTISFENKGETICKLIFESLFLKGETIMSLSDRAGYCGLLREGRAHISCSDADGEETIYESLDEGDCFGEYLIYPQPGLEYHVVADTDCKIQFINIQTAINGCGRECANHDELIKVLLKLASKRAQFQNMHINILSQRTIRAKLLTCFKFYGGEQTKGITFRLPMTYAVLANYLCVDRSAMMRELKKMNNDGIIKTDGRDITIL